MYLHIGKSIIINTNQIIGIFDIDSLKKGKSFLKNNEKSSKDNNIIDISEGKEKSYIIIKKEDSVVIYISNISSLTLAKRIKNNYILV